MRSPRSRRSSRRPGLGRRPKRAPTTRPGPLAARCPDA
jgi:hypothetical protein